MANFKLSRKVESVLAQSSGRESYMVGIAFMTAGILILGIVQVPAALQVLLVIGSWLKLASSSTWIDICLNVLPLVLICIGAIFIFWGWLSSRIKPIKVLVIQESYKEISYKTINRFIDGHADNWIKVRRVSRLNLQSLDKDLENYRQKIIKNVKKIDTLSAPYYVGIVHIPFAALIGFLTKNQCFSFIEIKHSTKEPVVLNSNNGGGSFGFSTQILNMNSKATEVSVVISVSHKIDLQEVMRKLTHPLLVLDAQHIKEFPYASGDELSDAATNIRREVLNLRSSFQKLSKVHVFYAGPTSLIILLSQMINSNIDPIHIVYNFERNSGYTWGVELNDNGGEIVRL